ncbi:MAG: tetratricopeptide repeat protein [Candidatus Shapirobacteria bacterium]|jgi:predicted Zn-dependent protease
MTTYISDPTYTPNQNENDGQKHGLIIALIAIQLFSVVATLVVYVLIITKNRSRFGNFTIDNTTSKSGYTAKVAPPSTTFISKSNQIKLDYSQGNYDKADSAATQLLAFAKTDDERAIAYYWQGLTSYSLKKYNDSEIYLNQALALNPKYAAPYVTLGSISQLRQDGQKMLEYSTKCISIDPKYAWCHNNLGIGYMMTNQKEKGIEEFREAVKLDPTQYVFNENLKRALSQ